MGPAPPAFAAECPNTGVAPAPDSVDEMREAVLCLSNAERRSRQLKPLRENWRLRRAAVGHPADMVRNGFFAPARPSRSTSEPRPDA